MIHEDDLRARCAVGGQAGRLESSEPLGYSCAGKCPVGVEVTI